ncbi:integration host factor subunit beta [Flavobacteriaceae bacterium]|nr:integration host factor subunit beta [Flavobacteriaceae bacterium]MDB2684757.1 integration host factor subunit beta [Flavobacteriaceae bacterium]
MFASKFFGKNINYSNMTKADIVSKISDKSGIEKADVLATVEAFMTEVKGSLEQGENVYLRGFGSFIIKTRAEKTGRNISKNTTIKIPAHNIPAFKPAKTFTEGVKSKVEVK